MRQINNARRKIKTGVMTAAVMAAIVMQTFPVFAEESADQKITIGSTVTNGESGVEMSTGYPGIMTKAGETVSFSLDFTSLDGESHNVDLGVNSMPEGWEGYYKGSSSQIASVHVNGEDPTLNSNVTYSLTVPAETEEGDYHVILQAVTESGDESELDLKVVVSEVEVGESNFSSEYPEQQGATGTSFSFDTTIVNNRGIDQSYSLSADAPEGWQVSFVPSGESAAVASIGVEADSSKGLTVNVTPAQNVEKGDYTISVAAVSAEDKLTTDLKVNIIGTYGVNISTPDQRLSFDAYENQESTVTLNITNTGNVDLENLNLSSSAPTDWEVSFNESSIDLLESGATKEITATVKPGKNVMVGDYVTTISITNDNVSSQADFRVSVKTSTTWGVVAVGILVILALALRYIFKKFGRR